ncbi:MAG: sulfurtransferase [Alphaproteobacteria bacterium]
MDYANPDGIVSTEWLERHLGGPDVRVIDASYWQPIMQRDAKAEYEDCHIPGAVRFDIDDVADPDSPLPHTLPDAELFARKVGQLGLGDGQRIVVYDNVGGVSAAARVWWMFRTYGHRQVAVLQGGFSKWLREQRPVDDLVVTPVPHVFTPRFDSGLLRSLDQVSASLSGGREQIVDARKAVYFHAVVPDPAEARPGHIPGSLNLPALDLLDGRELTILPADKLRQKFEAAGVDFEKPIIATCGSGVTCCLLALGLYLLGKTDVANYDGSWNEWSAHQELPVARE